jgi:hypothetical protein
MDSKQASLLKPLSSDVANVRLLVSVNVHVLFQVLLRTQIFRSNMTLEQTHSQMEYLGMSSKIESAAIRLSTVLVRAQQYLFI